MTAPSPRSSRPRHGALAPHRARGGRVRRGLAVALVLMLSLVAVPAEAATRTAWAAWTFSGTSGDYAGTLGLGTVPAIEATLASTSRGGQVGVVSGDSVWLSADTPVGAVYGSSRGEPYINLRPRVDTASGASVTTYTFDRPTPVANWAFVLGDIDADAVTVSAVGPDGDTLPASALGFRGGFNYCAPGLTGKPACTGDPADVPTWDADGATLTGNAVAADTAGAAAWFEPSEPISALTLTFVRRAGLPLYQTWFVALARDVIGTVADVTDPGAPAAPAATTLTLLDEDGRVVATTTTDDAGAYTFTGVAAVNGLTVEVAPPAGQTTEGPRRAAVDLTDGDAVADFAVRDIIPVPISGSVRADDGTPLGGVEIVLTGGDGATFTVQTDSAGDFLFDSVPPGTYVPSATPPAGYSGTLSLPPVTVPTGVETPITGQDFVFAALPTLSGVISADGEGIGGVVVTATSGTDVRTTVTGPDGSYAFPLLPAGEWTIAPTAPQGLAAPEPSRTVVVAEDDVTVDFVLVAVPLAGAITVTVAGDDGGAVAGTRITVSDGDTTVDRMTDADGGAVFEDLAPGTYTVTVVPPDGYTASGPAVQTVVITADGESLIVGFELAAVPDPSPSASPTTSPGPSPSPSATTPLPSATAPAPPQVEGDLAASGGDGAPAAVAVWGAAMIGIGGVVLAATHVRRRVRGR